MDKVQIEIGANIEELKQNIVQGIEALGSLKTACERDALAVDAALDKFADSNLVDEEKAQKSADVLNNLAQVAEDTDKRINTVMAQLARALGGDLASNFEGAKEVIGWANEELAKLATAGTAAEQSAVKAVSSLKALDAQAQKALKIDEVAASYEKLADAYRKAAEQAEAAAASMETSAAAAKENGVEGQQVAVNLEKRAVAMRDEANMCDVQASALDELAAKTRKQASDALKMGTTQKQVTATIKEGNAALEEHSRKLTQVAAKTTICVDEANVSIGKLNEKTGAATSQLKYFKIEAEKTGRNVTRMGRNVRSAGGEFVHFGGRAATAAARVAGGATAARAASAAFAGVATALTVGLGPVGIALLAIQGLAAAFDWLSDRNEEAAEQTKKFNETLSAGWKEWRRYWQEIHKIEFDERTAKRKLDDEEELNELARERASIIKRNTEVENSNASAMKSAIAMVNGQLDVEQERLESERQLGQLTLEQYADKKRQLAELVEMNRRDLAIEQEKATIRASEKTKEELQKQQKAIYEQRKELEAELQSFLTGGGSHEALSPERRAAILNEIKELQKQFADLSDQRRESRELELEERIQMEMGNVKRAYNALNEELGGMRDMPQYEYETAVKSLEERIERLNKELEETSAAISQTQETKTKAVLKINDVTERAEKDAQARHEIEQIRNATALTLKQQEEEWAQVQKQDIDTQIAWLQQQKEACAEESELQKKWNELLEERINSRLDKEYDSLIKATKTTANYTEKRSASERDILEADRALLKERLKGLRQLRAEATDYSQQKKLDEAIAEATRQMSALGRRSAELSVVERNGAIAMARYFTQFKATDIASAHKGYTGTLKQLQKQYAQQAKLLARQLSRRNKEGAMETYQRMMSNLAKQARIAKNPQLLNDEAKKLTESYKEIRKLTPDIIKSQMSLKRQQEETAAGLREASKELKDVKARSIGRAVQDATNAAQQTNAAVANVSQQAEMLKATMLTASNGFTNLSGVLSLVNAAASQGFGSVAAVLKKHSSELANLQKRVSTLSGL